MHNLVRILALPHDVPFEPILQRWIQPIDTLLHSLTGGEQDQHGALWQISSGFAQYVEPKWKFSPHPDEVIREVGVDAWRDFMEFIFSMLAVSAYKPDETSFEGVWGTLQKINKIAQANIDPDKTLSWGFLHNPPKRCTQLHPGISFIHTEMVG